MIGVIDYGMGNLGSVVNAISYLGYAPQLVSSPDELGACSHVVLPGVGSYAAAMDNLSRLGLIESIHRHVGEGKPLLGICLGMQLLSSKGTEHGVTPGLDIIPGEVTAMNKAPGMRLPHVGWNNVECKRRHPVFSGVRPHVDFYFVHSFHFRVQDANDVIAVTPYGDEFVSCVGRGNVVGVQFHPEKSQDNGLKIVGNFCGWDGEC